MGVAIRSRLSWQQTPVAFAHSLFQCKLDYSAAYSKWSLEGLPGLLCKAFGDGIKFERLDYGTLVAKQLHGELPVRLKELSGLTYREIVQLADFRDIKLHSLAKLYKDARKRVAAKKS